MTDKMPDVTSKMKAENHGYHTFLTTAECGECLDVGPDQECEICGGDIVYQKQVGVPWDICKQIFKSMYLSSDIEQKHAEKIDSIGVASVRAIHKLKAEHAEEIAALKAEHRAVMAGLCELAESWREEGEFLDGPDDDPSDRGAGKVYKKCAKQLLELIKQRISDE